MIPFSEESFEVVEDELDFLMGNMQSPDAPLEDVGRFTTDYLLATRAHAGLYLLIDADTEGYHHDLNVAGYVRRHLLRRCKRHGHADLHTRSARTEGFLDCLAAGNLELAREIGELSPAEWGAEDEYLDDHCYARFLYLWVARGPGAADELDALLARFEAALEGAASARLDVCRAFRRKDGAAFAEAFTGLLVAREEEVAATANLAEEFVVEAVNSLVFVEGLALLRLAEREGFATEAEYPGCPALARLPATAPPPSDPMPLA